VIGLVFASPLSAGFALVNAGLARSRSQAGAFAPIARPDVGLRRRSSRRVLRVASVAAPSGTALVPIALGAVLTIGFDVHARRREWLSRVNSGKYPDPDRDLEGSRPALPCLLGRADAATLCSCESAKKDDTIVTQRANDKWP
jgi:hypothetical protein